MLEDIMDRYLEGIAAMGIEFPPPQVKLDDCPSPVAKVADRLGSAFERYEVMKSTQSARAKEIKRFEESHQIVLTAHELEEYSRLTRRYCEITQELITSTHEVTAAVIELARLQGKLRNDT